MRVRALSILYRSLSSTSTLPTDVLVGLRGSISYFHTEVDPRFRNEFVVIAKRLLQGIVTVISSSKKYSLMDRDAGVESLGSDDRQISSREGTVHQHLDFLKFYMHFLAKELQPTASYQRHVTALQILATSLRVSEPLLALGPFNQDAGWPEQRSYTGILIRPLVDLTMDPFDDVRGTASSVLLTILETMSSPQIESLQRGSIPASISLATNAHKQGKYSDLFRPLTRAQTMLRATSRADHADGVARLYNLRWQSCRYEDSWHGSKPLILEELLTGLEEDVSITASDLYLAVGTRPLHGHLISLRLGPVFRRAISKFVLTTTTDTSSVRQHSIFIYLPRLPPGHGTS